MKSMLVGFLALGFLVCSPNAEAGRSRVNRLKKAVTFYMVEFTENKPITKSKKQIVRNCRRRRRLSRNLARLDVVLGIYRKKRNELSYVMEDFKMIGVTLPLMQKQERLLRQLDLLNKIALKDAKRLVRACR